MVRPLFAVVFAVAALAAAGCQKTGAYVLSWSFAGEEAHVGCGAHGVDAIRVTGASTEGDGHVTTEICAKETLTRGVPVGTWTFMVHQLDVRGREIVVPELDANGQIVPDANGQPTLVPNHTPTATIGEDASVTLEPAVLVARPECGDGVDNDGDFRVDIDDPECGNSLNTAAE